MRRNDAVFASPPPPLMAVQQNTVPEQPLDSTSGGGAASSHDSSHSFNSSFIITIIILATAVIVSASIYLLLRCVSLYCRHRRRFSSLQMDAVASGSLHHQNHNHSHGSSSRVAPEGSSVIDSLRLFTFDSITGSNAAAGGDCAVCLSRFEPQDRLRLLPVCCHAFHTGCIDAWLATNQTCPLCRSSIFVSESDVMSKIPSAVTPNSASRSGSFRVEIGNVSGRHVPSHSSSGSRRRSYSIGSFDYIIDDVLSEVTVTSNCGRSDLASGGDKSCRLDEAEIYVVAPPGETLAAEVASGGERGRSSWLKDYVERIAWTPSFSLSSSFRSSGRFFAGSSRRTEASRVHESDLEASRLGDEIGEMFRWLSAV